MSSFTPSAGPRWERCLGSAVLPQASEEFDSTSKGKALHAFLRSVGLGVTRQDALTDVPEPFRKDAERVDVPEDIVHGWPELGLALDLTKGTARAFRPDMTREQVFTARLPHEVGMLPDWVAVQGERALVRDWKIGWQEDLGPAADHLQLLIYTASALLAFAKDEARGELWHWDGVRWRVDGVTLDFLGALEVLERVRTLTEKTKLARREYESNGTLPRLSLGKWCAWCPAQRACPARSLAVREAIQRADGAGEPLAAMNPQEAGQAYQRLKLARTAIDAMLVDLESIAGQTPLPLPDGTVLRQQEREVTRIDAPAAEEWLRKTFGDAAAGAAVETKVVMTWEGLKDALRTQVLPERLRAHAEGRLPGRKPTLAALVQQARGGLEATGAVQVSTYTACRPVRPELSADAQPPEPGFEG